jgi:hypothetical protein
VSIRTTAPLPQLGEINVEALAAGIRKLSAAAERLERSGLTRRALLVLLKAETRIDHVTIGRILDALPKLQAIYTRKGTKEKS